MMTGISASRAFHDHTMIAKVLIVARGGVEGSRHGAWTGAGEMCNKMSCFFSG